MRPKDYKTYFSMPTLGEGHQDDLKAHVKRSARKYFKKSVDKKLLRKLRHYLVKRQPQVLCELERAVKDKNITKGFKNYQQQLLNLKTFMGPEKKDFTGNINYIKAREILVKSILPKKTKLRKLDLEKENDVERAFSNKKASAGAVAPGKQKHEVMDIIVDTAKWMLENPEAPGIPALCFERSQISNFIVDGKIDSTNIKHKTRLVWCIDAATVLVEAMFARPLMDETFKSVKQYAGGKPDEDISLELRKWNKYFWLCLDFSQFDGTIPSWLIKDMFTILKQYFDKKHWWILDWICDKFINTTIIMPDGRIYQKHKGIPSGSYFTQIIGSMCNMQMILTYMYSLHGEKIHEEMNMFDKRLSRNKKYYCFMVMGDDNIVFTRTRINKKHLSTYMAHNFGVKVHPDKCDEGNHNSDPVFLKRRWTRDGAKRDLLEFLVQAVHPERRRDYDTYSEWHILYGYFLTYSGTMKDFITREAIERGMKESGGSEILLRMDRTLLPGALRYKMIVDPVGWARRISSSFSVGTKAAASA